MKLDMQQITHQMRFYISEVKRLQDQVKNLSAKLEKYEGSDKDEFNPDNDKHMEILVVQSTGEIESITTASLTGFTSDYWEGDGTGTGIKTSGYTNTTVKIRKLDVDDGAIEYDPNNSVVKFGGDNSVVFNQDNGDVEFTVLGGSGGGSSNKVFQLDLADGGHGATFFTNNGNTPTQTLVVNGIISGNATRS